MSKLTSEKFIYSAAVTIAAISVLASFALIAAQVFVRWNLNQTFTFLGGFELDALTVSSFSLVIALMFRARKREESKK